MGKNEDFGIQYCGKYGSSQTRRAEVVEKMYWLLRTPRTCFWVGTILGRKSLFAWKSLEPRSARRDMMSVGASVNVISCLYLGREYVDCAVRW